MITIIPGLTNSGFEKNWLRSDGKANLQFETGMTPEYLATKILDAIRAEPPGGRVRQRGPDIAALQPLLPATDEPAHRAEREEALSVIP